METKSIVFDFTNWGMVDGAFAMDRIQKYPAVKCLEFLDYPKYQIVLIVP